MLCQKWMEQDLKEKVQEQDAGWDAVKKIQVIRILPDLERDQEIDVSPVEAGDKETG